MKVFKRVSALFLALLLAVSFFATFALNANAEVVFTKDTTSFTVYFEPNGAKGSTEFKTKSLDEKKNGTMLMPSAIEYDFVYEGKTFIGWSIGGTIYRSGATYTFSTNDAKLDDSNQYEITAKAQWETKSSQDAGETIYGTYDPGDGKGTIYQKKYVSGEKFKLDDCKFTFEGHQFTGWEIDGKVYSAGVSVIADSDFTAKATWESGKPVLGGDSSSSSSSSSSSTSSSQAPKPSSSKSSSSVPTPKPSSSSSSESVSEEPIPEPVPEPTPEPIFEPTELGYTISGDIPVTKISFLLNEDIGGTPSLWVNALDSYSATDDVTSDFIASQSALAAFDLSLLSDGANYNGPVVGVVTYELNGTQAGADSLYEENVLALVHVIDRDKFTGNSYYIPDGKKAYLYDTASGSKNEVGNLSFAESEGVSRPVLADIDGLSEFAYLADENTIVEVKLIPDPSVSSVSMEVSSLSPFLLTQLEIGKASSGAGIPVWVWIIIAVVILAIIVLVALFLFNRRNQKRSGGNAQPSHRNEQQATVTGFDE